MYPGGLVRQIGLSYRPAMQHRMAESIPRNRFQGSITDLSNHLQSAQMFNDDISSDSSFLKLAPPRWTVSLLPPVSHSYSLVAFSLTAAIFIPKGTVSREFEAANKLHIFIPFLADPSEKRQKFPESPPKISTHQNST
jgi:hypothetical protein